MAVSRYWRIVGVCTRDNGQLELSEARIYENGVLADATASLSVTLAPGSGSLVDLRDSLTTGVVTWSYASYSLPGFALVWDFGAGLGVDGAQFVLGAGSNAGTFPLDLVIQRSSDSVNWSTYSSYVTLDFPGALATTPTPSASSGDAQFQKVKLLLHGDGANNATVFTDVIGHTVIPSGNAKISTAQTKTGGSVMAFDGSGDFLTIPSSVDFDFGQLYAIEAWVYPNSISGNFGIFHRGFYTTTTNTWSGFTFSTRWLGTVLRVYFYATQYSDEQYVDIAGAFTAGTWTHLAVTRDGSVGKVYINGILAGTRTGLTPTDASTQTFRIGIWDYSAGAEYFNGYLQDVRLTQGSARYSDNFTPPTIRLPDSAGAGLGSSLNAPRLRQQPPAPERVLPATALPAAAVQGHLREMPFFDAYNGGIGIIYGSTKEKHTPANTPLRRKVLLMDEGSQIVVRATWSDAVTGAFEFRGVKEGVTYTVLSYDHTGAYRAVVADHQVPELIV